MIGSTRYIVVELDGARLSAISADIRGERVILKSWNTAACPDSVNQADEKAMLAWATDQLTSWKLGRGRVVFSVPRGEVVLKRLHVAGAADVDDDDRAGIVALQMGRQLSLSMQDPAIDYVPVASGEGESGLEVTAGALPGARLEWLTSLAKATGTRLQRVGLRSEGVATLVAGAASDDSGAVLGINPGAATTDFVIVEGGELRFARAADIGLPTSDDDLENFADRVGVEAKRT